jgi:hypothetical protein
MKSMPLQLESYLGKPVEALPPPLSSWMRTRSSTTSPVSQVILPAGRPGSGRFQIAQMRDPGPAPVGRWQHGGNHLRKLSEAEVLVAGGVKDVLIANLVVGKPKAERLAVLNHAATVRAAVDGAENVEDWGRRGVDPV